MEQIVIILQFNLPRGPHEGEARFTGRYYLTSLPVISTTLYKNKHSNEQPDQAVPEPLSGETNPPPSITTLPGPVQCEDNPSGDPGEVVYDIDTFPIRHQPPIPAHGDDV
ncbi:hypothetical protein J4Q44_G00243110 [Coregonus suidteri]|uniref:Uncharacterized protein n=1 Tax=Coregonus suidteri TaxID=861788 RepID=A0AAN8LL97_9TELE